MFSYTQGAFTCEAGHQPSTAPPPPSGPNLGHTPPLWTPQPILVSTWFELATWVLAAPRKFFQRGKFAQHLISPHLFTFKMLTMS